MRFVGSKKTIWQGLEWKIILITVVIVSCFVFLIVQKMKEPRPGSLATDEQTIQQPAPKQQPGRLPSANGEPAGPLYPMDSWSNYPDPTGSGMSGRNTTGRIPGNPAAVSGNEPYPVSSPTTQVHSLSEAEQVMGMPSNEVGAIGVTRTYQLPGRQSGANKKAITANPIGVPPGADPSETGISKSYPLPKDPNRP